VDLKHTFTVPASVADTWQTFEDIESVAGCFPGATVTEVDGNDFKGTCKVKLGPIALVYAGSGTFLEKDEAARTFVIEAKGKDKRGNGTAGAMVTLTMDGSAGTSTDVKVHTDLAITGKPAQFGRGVMQDVSDKLLNQFVACLEQRMGEGDGAAEAPAAAAAAPVADASAPAEDAAAATPAEPAAPAAAAQPAPAAANAASAPGARKAPPAARGSDDALDLGKTVLPVLMKSYWKQALAGVVVVGVIVWIIVR
jgi:carbon monoxide dehydrogenase subunit G